MSELGKARLKSRLEDFKVKRKVIWEEYVAGATVTMIANKYGVTRQNISNILKKAEKENSTNGQETNNQVS